MFWLQFLAIFRELVKFYQHVQLMCQLIWQKFYIYDLNYN